MRGVRSWATRDILKVSISGVLGSGETYEVEGRVLVYLKKEWSDEQEGWQTKVVDWEGEEPFTLMGADGAAELLYDEELQPDMKEQIECLIAQTYC